MSERPRWSWSQPICPVCYAIRYPGREPVRLRQPEPERCVDCDSSTSAGVFIRVDPKTARYPSRRESE